MAVDVKICGLRSSETVTAAVAGGARFVGFVFFAPSPRCITTARAGRLTALVPPAVHRVGLVVDADDDTLAEIVAGAGIDMLQLHGAEPPERVAAVRSRFGLPVMKAVAIADTGDLARAAAYEAVADWLLFDARPPAEATRPGGNARPFDWSLLAARRWQRRWMLAGGLNAGNLAEAVRRSGATVVDVSSGVEDAPGEKNVARIGEFLRLARQVGLPDPAGAS
jgi:phosphoribosylanthranilate isomerase